MTEYFTGRVQRVIFEEPNSAFYIIKVALDSDEDQNIFASSFAEDVTVKGVVVGLQVKSGLWFGFEADWVTHPQYGRQLKITKAPIYADYLDPQVISELLRAQGVAGLTCYKLVKTFGKDLHQALSDADRLQRDLEISSLEADHLKSNFERCIEELKAFEVLHTLRLSDAIKGKLWRRYGRSLSSILLTNPWQLVEMDYFTFDQLDAMARQAGLDFDCVERRSAAIFYVVAKGTRAGHLFLYRQDIQEHLLDAFQMSFDQPEADAALQSALDDKLLYTDVDTSTGREAVYDPWLFELEEVSAYMLHGRSSMTVPFPLRAHQSDHTLTFDERRELVSEAIDRQSELSGLTLTETQKDGVLNAFLHPVSYITGLPGTGKSTSLKILVRTLQSFNCSVELLAPTGIAAKRMEQLTKHPAYTIHRRLGAKHVAKQDDGIFSYAGVVENSSVDLSAGRSSEWGSTAIADVVVIDESSMVDMHLLYRILMGTRESSPHLVFVGDPEQLPSVGPGEVLTSLIDCGLFPGVHLTEIFRQDEASAIVKAAHAIHRGEMPEFTGDFVLMEKTNEADIQATVLSLAERMYDLASNWEARGRTGPPVSFQTLSPRHKGDIGVTQLNRLIRSRINPESQGKREIKIRGFAVREGDRVMVTQNDNDRGVFNGDMGKVIKIDTRNKLIYVKIHGDRDREVAFKVHEAGRCLRLSYTCTVHKYQGLEIDVVIMPWSYSFGRQLQRNLLYTAITRGKQRVVIVGDPRAVARAVLNENKNTRNTLLAERLRNYDRGLEPPQQRYPELFKGDFNGPGQDRAADSSKSKTDLSQDQIDNAIDQLTKALDQFSAGR